MEATEAAPSSAIDKVLDLSDKLMVAEAVSDEAKLDRLLGEHATFISAWTSSRRDADALDTMLPARPSWLADSQSSRSLSRSLSRTNNWLALPNEADPEADRATLASPTKHNRPH